MYASSERSVEVSQNSAIISAKRLTLAVARAASLAFQAGAEHLEIPALLHQLEEEVADVEARGQFRKGAKKSGESGRRHPAPKRIEWRHAVPIAQLRQCGDRVEVARWTGQRSGERNDVSRVAQDSQQRDHILDLRPVVEAVTADHDMWKAARRQGVGDRARDGVRAAEHGDLWQRHAVHDEALCLRCDGARLGGAVGAEPQLHLGPSPAGPQLFGKALGIVPDEGGRGRDDAARAPMVAAERDRQRQRESCSGSARGWLVRLP